MSISAKKTQENKKLKNLLQKYKIIKYGKISQSAIYSKL